MSMEDRVPAKMSAQKMNEFLDEKHVGIIVTINSDGTPNPQPIWYMHRDGAFLMRTSATSVKANNIARDARISICVQNETLPYASVTVWGTASVSTKNDTALGREIAVRYLGEKGADRYAQLSARSPDTAEEITITLRPDRTFSQDYAAEAGAEAGA